MKDLLNEGGSIFIVVPNSPRLINTDPETDGFVTRIKRSIKEWTWTMVIDECMIFLLLKKIFPQLGLYVKQKKGLVFKILADFQLNKLLKTNFLNENHILALQEIANQESNIKFSDSFF